MPETITILIADDHPVFREGLRSLLETTSDLHVIAEASTGREAVQRTLELRPDITLMDVTMPDGDGINAVREIRQQIPNANILMLTMLQDDDTARHPRCRRRRRDFWTRSGRTGDPLLQHHPTTEHTQLPRIDQP
jgi:CheY-like chemotaxis protein